MKRLFLMVLILVVGAWGVYLSGVDADEKSNLESLKAVEGKGGTTLDEIAAIANILYKNPGMVHLNPFSQEFCVRSPNGAKYMVHFSKEPSKTPEDVLLFLDPEPFSKAGLNPSDFPPLPKTLGKMEAYQWYYYDGKYEEPHHHRMLPPYLVMAYSVKD